jgi:HlyD family secretion protein
MKQSVGRLRKILGKVFGYAMEHKAIAFLVVLALGYGGYFIHGHFFVSAAPTRYMLAQVSRGTVVASVSASGQVSASDQIDIKPKAMGEVTWVGVKAGDAVRAGQALARIDDTDARQAIADAVQALAQAKLQFQKDSAQAPIDYEKSLEALADSKKALTTTWSDTFNTVSNTYLTLPGVMTGMQNLLYGYDLSPSKIQWNISSIKNIFPSIQAESGTVNTLADIAERDYSIARNKYDPALALYKQLTRYSATDDLEKSLDESGETVTAVAQALQSTLNMLDTVIDYAGKTSLSLNPTISTMRSTAEGYLSTTNSTLSAILAQQKSLDASRKAVRDNERTVEIYKIGNPTGGNPISLQSSSYSIADQERKFQQLKVNLADYTITAPFAGTISVVNLKKFDTVSTGTSVATLITHQKIAQLSLNEVDAAKVSLGDKATITFDALENLTLTGSVIEMDPVGAVSQGVVSYAVKIGFESDNERVKPGMTANAAIITEAHTDVLVVPASAVKTQANQSYVLAFNPPLPSLEVTGSVQGVTSDMTPQQIPVETGISDNTNIEILSGLTEGQQIVARMVTASTKPSANSAPSLIGGGNVRVGGGRAF